MRLGGLLTVALLAISIASFGISGPAYASSHDIRPITATTNLPIYEDGDVVEITGKIKDFASLNKNTTSAVIIIFWAPDNAARVGVDQVKPNSDGSFSSSFKTGGPYWKASGVYDIDIIFKPHDPIRLSIEYTSSVAAPLVCGPDQELVDGQCIDTEPTPPPPPPPPPPPVCGPDQELIDNECIDKPPPPPPVCGPDQELIDNECIDKPPQITCGEGTVNVNGTCVPIPPETTDPGTDDGGGCLIATAAFGSELAPHVQFLREVRDNTVMSTASGTAFMTGFNQVYYSFSPAVADLERENPVFRDAVRAFITPMVSSLSIMTLADPGSEAEVLGLGISVIMLNLGLYIAAPALVGFKIHKYAKSRLA